jgi:DNA-binding transcriptional ArsR family regulator
MPNRIVRVGIIDSPRIENLVREGGWEAECFYRRLLSVVDDYGCFDARICVLRASCYPTLLDFIRDSNVERHLMLCEKVGLVRLYEVGNSRYVEVRDFKQNARSPRKFPEPLPDKSRACIASATHVRSKRDAHDAHLRAYSETNAHALNPPTPLAGGGGEKRKISRKKTRDEKRTDGVARLMSEGHPILEKR